MLEIRGKFPSSEMVHKLAAALCIDPTELFLKEIDSEIAIKNSQKAAIEDVGEEVGRIISAFFAKKVLQYSADCQPLPPQEPDEPKG
jgi:hypothetical protein